MKKVYNVIHRMFYLNESKHDVQMAQFINPDDAMFSNEKKAVEYAKELSLKCKELNGKPMEEWHDAEPLPDQCVNTTVIFSQKEYGTDEFRHVIKVLKYVIQ